MTQQLNDSTADLKKKQLEFFTHKIKTLCNIKPQLALNAASDTASLCYVVMAA